MTFIETYSGVAFHPLAPIVDDICIEDIAHALSHQCRFSGHTKTFYSVAEHCVRVARLLDFWGEAPKTIFWGLLHDASEAYLVDIPTPLKRSDAFEGYRKAELRLMHAICRAFSMSSKEPKIVRRADAVLLATEARDMMPFRCEHWGALTEEPLRAKIIPWSPAEAERAFLVRFATLNGELNVRNKSQGRRRFNEATAKARTAGVDHSHISGHGRRCGEVWSVQLAGERR